MNEILTITDALAIAEILRMAQAIAKVGWVGDDGVVRYGTARHLVSSETMAGFLNHDQDVRTAYLRVTTEQGYDTTLLVSDLMPKITDGTFAAV